MIIGLLIRLWATPENVLGLCMDVAAIVAMCFIFTAWKEKWWKSLVPFYGTYIIFKNVWRKRKWLFFVSITLNIVSSRCVAFFRKHLIIDLIDTIKTYIETEQLSVEIDLRQLLICILIYLVSVIISFVITRISYLKICESLQINNVLLKIGTFLFPQVFLFADYVTWRMKHKESSQ